MFKIDFLDDPVPGRWKTPQAEEVLGEITIGDLSEKMAIPLTYWTQDQYKKQWSDAADRLLVKDGNKSVFITQVHDPAKKNVGYLMECWSAYREGDAVYFRNFYLTKESLPGSWDENSLADLAEDRKADDKVSEWKVSLTEVKAFQNRSSL